MYDKLAFVERFIYCAGDMTGGFRKMLNARLSDSQRASQQL